MEKSCPLCGNRELKSVVEIDEVPVFCNVLWPTREEALEAPRGKIELTQCGHCTHFFNLAFDPTLTEYSTAYENSLHFSERFNQYASDLARRLVDTFDLRGKDVIEVGCGRGDFLRMLCETGNCRGIGFDQSNEEGTVDDPLERGQIRFINRFLTPAHPTLPVDFLCCRHVLEHVQSPLRFLKDLRAWLERCEGNPVLYFEVPNALYTVDRGGIWDLIFEHYSYFTVQSLTTLFAEAGFRPFSWGEAFGGQYLFVLTELPPGSREGPQLPRLDPDSLRASVEGFRDGFKDRTAAWAERIANARKEGTSMALWGGGSKGVTFLNFLDPGDVVQCVVDINPRKQGRFVAGTGHPIVPPQELATRRPGVVIVTNTMYLDEIEAELECWDVGAMIQAV